MQAKMRHSCIYCHFKPADGERCNGLDRVDNSAGYTDANTAPSCSACNSMKASLPVDAFLAHVHRIVSYSCRGVTAPVARDPNTDDVMCGSRGCGCKDKDPSSLSAAVKIGLWTSPCYLCGLRYAMGIDRVDSSRGYVPDNVAPCCRQCNYMKKHYGLVQFKEHIVCIAAAHPDPPETEHVLYDNISGKALEPIGAFDGEELFMAFPAPSWASKMPRAKNGALAWKTIDVRTYLDFQVEDFGTRLYNAMNLAQ